MAAVLLADLGSTYTKVVAVDLKGAQILGTASAPTTVETNICEGLFSAIEILQKKIGPIKFRESYASSSAAGGLKMVASVLIPNYA